MGIIPGVQNKAEIIGSAEKTKEDNTQYQKEQDMASKTLPNQKEKVNETLYKPASDFSKKFLKNLKKLEDSKNIDLAVKETGYSKKEGKTQEDFIDELAEKWTNLQIKEENLVEESQNKNSEGKIEATISQDKVEFTRGKILSRLDMGDDNKKNNLSKNLDNPKNRKENFEKAKSIFFGKEQLIEDIKGNDSLLKFSGNIFKKEGNEIKIIDEDLTNILGNFVTNIEGKNLNDLDNGSQIEAKNVLNDCFELEINKLLDGKNSENYNSIVIEQMKSEILNDEINKTPLEKLQKFKELKLSLQSSIASKFVKTNKLLKKNESKELKLEKNKMAELFNNLKNNLDKIFVNPSKNKILKDILENYKKIEKTIKGGDIMSGGKNEKINSNLEKTGNP